MLAATLRRLAHEPLVAHQPFGIVGIAVKVKGRLFPTVQQPKRLAAQNARKQAIKAAVHRGDASRLTRRA
jgi:hypothetical protein